MTISVIQQSGTVSSATLATPLNLTAFASAVTAGNTILVAIVTYGMHVPDVTDSLGNQYVCDNQTAPIGIVIMRASNIAGGTPTISVRAKDGGSFQYWAAAALEVTPIVVSVVGPTAAGSSAPAVAGSITTIVAQSLVIAVCGVDGTSGTFAGSGFTRFGYALSASTEGLDAQYQIYNSTTTVNPTWTGATAWRAVSMAYAASSPGGGLLVPRGFNGGFAG